ncbi:lysophospholipase [Trametes elegans]|nr:lysophospholipase [Trametes elegans]
MLVSPRVLLFWTLACAVSARVRAGEKYAPDLQPCPTGVSLLREVGPNAQAQTLSHDEQLYIQQRRSQVLPGAWTNYAANVESAADATLPEYIDQILRGAHGQDALPNLGIATSGGGLRAALFGAGILSSLDGRNTTSAQAGIGGLLQAATYISGLSGGAWLVTSLAQANFPMLPDLIFGTLPAGNDRSATYGGWITTVDLLDPLIDPFATDQLLPVVLQEIADKAALGFPVSIADVWGRSLARHFVNGTTASDIFEEDLEHGAGITLSSLSHVPTFSDAAQPFPIVIADSLTAGPNKGVIISESGVVVPLVNPIYEFNVFETGSFDPSLGAFTPTKLLGSPNSTICAKEFDQLSFVQASSSCLFNTLNTSDAALLAGPVGPIISGLRNSFSQPGIRLDSAQVPNPFFGVAPDTYVDSASKLLSLVDGGEDAETTPFQPLLVKARGVDTIIAIDAPADTSDNFADGSSLIATQQRVNLLSSAYSFPPVPPTQSEFLSQNLTTRPTFFGCNSAASSGDPLVIYLANGGAPLGETPLTNKPTTQLSYTSDAVQAILDQVFDVATQGIPISGANGAEEKDPDWPVCLACAVVDRSRRELGIARSGVCATCLDRYCWS